MPENNTVKIFFMSLGVLALTGIVAMASYDTSRNFFTASLPDIDSVKVKDINSQETQGGDSEEQIDYYEEDKPITDSITPRKVFESGISVKVEDGQNKVLFSKNENQKLPIASLAKLMAALIVLENYDLDQKVVISESAMAQEGEQGSLKLGEELSVKNLLYITLMESSNRSAQALAEVVGADEFIALMNEKARALELNDTYFADSTGLDKNTSSTVQDLVKLTQHLFENYPLFKEIINLKEYGLYPQSQNGQFHHKLINTNKLLWQNRIVGGKTGWTEEALGCFLVIQKYPNDAGYLIHVILGSSDRLSDMKNLIQMF